MPKGIPQHKQVAKLIREKFQELGIEGEITSESYIGGSSIYVNMKDQPRHIVEEIETFARQYKTGTPSVKYMIFTNEMSDGKAQELYERIRSTWDGGKYLPQGYKQAENLYFHGFRISQMVYKEFHRC